MSAMSSSYSPTRELVTPLGSTSNLLVPPSAHVLSRSKTARKPLRSSPLAASMVISLNEAEEEEISTVPRSSSYDSDFLSPTSSHSRPGSSQSSRSLSRPTSMLSMYSTTSSSSPESTSRRPASPDNTSPKKRPLSAIFMFNSTLTREEPGTDVSDAAGTSSARLRHSQRDFNGGNNDGAEAPHARDSWIRQSASPAGPSTFSSGRRPVSVVLEDETEGTSTDSTRVGARTGNTAPRDNSWYVSNTYAETPKFSRLGLASSNVVMPVSAKDHRKRQTIHFKPPPGVEPLIVVPDASSSGDTAMRKIVNRRSSIGAALSSGLGLKRSITSASHNPSSSSGETESPVPLLPPRSQSAIDVTRANASSVDSLPPPPPLPAAHPPSPSPSATSSASGYVSASESFTRTSSSTDSSSTSSLPLPFSPYSTPSLVNSSQTSVSDETATQHASGQRDGTKDGDSPNRKRAASDGGSIGGSKVFSIGPNGLSKRKSVVERMKNWGSRTPASAIFAPDSVPPVPPVPPLPIDHRTTAVSHSMPPVNIPKPPIPTRSGSSTTTLKATTTAAVTVHVEHVDGAKEVDRKGKDGLASKKKGTIKKFFRVFVGGTP